MSRAFKDSRKGDLASVGMGRCETVKAEPSIKENDKRPLNNVQEKTGYQTLEWLLE